MGEPQSDAANLTYRYDAFISYRHVEPDRKWAKWLHGALETYRVPKELVAKGFPRRLTRVFRDEEELPANADLSTQITAALDDSKFLIVICSPRAVESRWVNAEVEHFRKLGRHDRILALLIEGEPAGSFPPALTQIRRSLTDTAGQTREQVEEVEPLAADVRPDRTDEKAHTLRSHARLRLLACILGCRFDDLRQREAERRARRARLVGAGLMSLAVVLSLLTVYAFSQRSEAIAQRGEAQRQARIAESNAAEAQRQQAEAEKQKNDALAARDAEARERARAEAIVQFQKNMLATADPANLLGDKVTVLQAMQAAIKNLDSGQLNDQPLVEADVRDTIGTTLRNLARLDDAEPNLHRALELRRKSLPAGHPDIATSLSHLANLLQLQNKLSEAERLDRESLDILRAAYPAGHPDLAMGLQNVAVVLNAQHKSAEAEPLVREALEIWRKALPAEHPTIAYGLHTLAKILREQNKLAEAEPLYREALAIRRVALPAGHPDIAESLNNLAVLLRDQNKLADAEPLLREALEIRRQYLPSGHPELAQSTLNLANLLNRNKKFEEAEPLFRESLAIVSKAYGQTDVRATAVAFVAANNLEALGRRGEAKALRQMYRFANNPGPTTRP